MGDRDIVRKPLHGIFTSVTPQYDLINHVMTLGLDFGWRRKAVQACLEGAPGTVLDLCCGTGDLGFGIAAAADFPRSEERRVGKECRMPCRSRWSPYH